MPVAAIAMLAPALIQGALGAAQYFGGRKLAKTPTPAYQIPNAVNQMVSTQRRYAQGEMPGLSAMESNQRQTTANAFENMGKFGVIDPNTASSLYGQERGMLGNIGLQGAQYQVGEKDKYLNTLGVLADEQSRQWDWNVAQPFERTMSTASSLMGSGIQNVWGGVSSAGDYLAQRNMMQNLGYDTPSWFGNMFGGENSTSTNNTITDPVLRNFMQTNPATKNSQMQAMRAFYPNLFD